MRTKDFIKIFLFSALTWIFFYYLFPIPFLPDSSYILRVLAGQVYSRIIFFVFLFGLFALWESSRKFSALGRVAEIFSCTDLKCLSERTFPSPLSNILKAFLRFSYESKNRQELVALFTAHLRSFKEWAEEKFTVVRVIIWSLPLLGFIGTVVGVSMAIAGFKVGGEGTSSFVQSFSQVSQGLYTAFDTTFLGLVLVLIMMFLYSLVWRGINSSLTALEGFILEKIIPILEFPQEEKSPLGIDVSEIEEKLKAAVEQMEKGAKVLSSISRALLLSLAEEEKEKIIDELAKREL